MLNGVFFPKIEPLWDNVEKYSGDRGATNNVTIWRIGVACWTSNATCTYAHAHAHAPGYTHASTHACTHRPVSNTYRFFTATMICERASVFRYMYTAPLVYFWFVSLNFCTILSFLIVLVRASCSSHCILLYSITLKIWLNNINSGACLSYILSILVLCRLCLGSKHSRYTLYRTLFVYAAFEVLIAWLYEFMSWVVPLVFYHEIGGSIPIKKMVNSYQITRCHVSKSPWVSQLCHFSKGFSLSS